MPRNEPKNDNIITVSFSGLDKFKKCPKLYEHYYINKDTTQEPLKQSLLQGSWVHTLLEQRLLDPSLDTYELYTEYLDEWLVELELEFDAVQKQEIIYITTALSDLLYRGSAHCTDNNKLRTSNGSYLKNPILYPSASFKKALRDVKNINYKSKYDNLAGQQRKDFYDVPFCWSLANSLFMANLFTIPKGSETLHTELPFGTQETNLVPLGTTGCNLKGYIDWIVRLSDNRIAIIDHKTSAEAPLQLDVLFHPQLNLYAHAYKVLYGEYPQLIGINHVRSKRIICAEVDPKIVEQTVQYYIELYMETLSSDFVRYHPYDYNTPCFRRDYNTKKITSVCPYLGKCWPDYKKLLHI